jgi:hypothetical protein
MHTYNHRDTVVGIDIKIKSRYIRTDNEEFLITLFTKQRSKVQKITNNFKYLFFMQTQPSRL